MWWCHRPDTHPSIPPDSDSSHSQGHIHQRGYSHNALDTPAHMCHPEKLTHVHITNCFVMIYSYKSRGQSSGRQTEEIVFGINSQGRAAGTVPLSTLRCKNKSCLLGHKPHHWHIGKFGYSPNPKCRWSKGWNSRHLANLSGKDGYRHSPICLLMCIQEKNWTDFGFVIKIFWLKGPVYEI